MQSVGHVARAERSGRRHGSIVFPVVLVGLGLIFLAQNLGWVGGDVWLGLWRYWPVLLVLVGIDLVIGRSFWAFLVGSVVAFALVVGAVILSSPLSQMAGWRSADGWSWPSGPVIVEQVVEELGDARTARVHLRQGAGRLAVASLAPDSDALIDAELAHLESTEIERIFERNGEVLEVRLRDVERRTVFFGGYRADWTVGLSPRVPIALSVDAGASNVDLDLRLLAATRVDVTAGAGQVQITLPQEAGPVEARIKAGAGRVVVTVPDAVPARIRADSGVSTVQIDDSRFPRAGRYYQSPDYEGATSRVDLRIETGVGEVVVR